VVVRWSAESRRAREPVESAPPPASPSASPYDKILEKELKDFDG
jgi:hypothetical protein